jgi:HD-GYP domain-containing protein (c-di-GMP phosphodiesterase class II)
MISNRPYRTAMSAEGAISELQRNAGTQFDPRVVAAFVFALVERERVAPPAAPASSAPPA